MEQALNIVYIAFIAVTIVELYFMVKWDLQMLQQNSYFNSRYIKWLRTAEEHITVKRVITFTALVMMLVTYVGTNVYNVSIIMACLIAQCVYAYREKHKLPLVFTKRVKRMFATEMLLLIAIIVAVAVLSSPYHAVLAALLLLSFSYLVTIAVNFALHPVEKHIADGFVRDAKQRLEQMPGLTVIGITGSYGKTSTKHYLNRILSEKFSVLMTPGSFNTTMGVVRTIREHMQPYNEIFICEMGAKKPGDIKEICDIAHPRYGIITAVGKQHLETFKTINNVQRTKFELADALPADGLVVLNNDFEWVANRQVTNVPALRYSVNAGDGIDFYATDVQYSSHGTTFTVHGPGKSIPLSTRLVGECNISNLIAAVAIAVELGVEDEKIQYAVSKIEQVEHRLNVKRSAGGITIIDDAYNSNPTGSRMALDVLSHMNTGKRIVITPGMIELGSEQVELNRAFGCHIAETCDIAIIVGQYNRDAIVDGIKSNGFNEKNLYVVNTLNDAQRTLATIAAPGDTVLYENDLPDTFK